LLQLCRDSRGPPSLTIKLVTIWKQAAQVDPETKCERLISNWKASQRAAIGKHDGMEGDGFWTDEEKETYDKIEAWFPLDIEFYDETNARYYYHIFLRLNTVCVLDFSTQNPFPFSQSNPIFTIYL
jgi:hypothetical protein